MDDLQSDHMTGAVPQPHANLMRKMVWLPKMGAVLLADQGVRNALTRSLAAARPRAWHEPR